MNKITVLFDDETEEVQIADYKEWLAKQPPKKTELGKVTLASLQWKDKHG